MERGMELLTLEIRFWDAIMPVGSEVSVFHLFGCVVVRAGVFTLEGGRTVTSAVTIRSYRLL